MHTTTPVCVVTVRCLLPILAALLLNACAAHDLAPTAAVPAHAGLIGPAADHGPPLHAAAWHKREGDVLAYSSNIWGRRAIPIEVLAVPDGVALLYNSKPPVGYDQGAQLQTGSIAFSRNLVDWRDYPGNPILYELKQPWQGRERMLLQAALFDPTQQRWVVYFGDANGQYPGMRAVAVAYSHDLIHWEYDENNPLFTIEDYAAAVPDRMEATLEEQRTGGRVYVRWARYHEGKYCLVLQGSIRTGEGRRYHAIPMVSDSPAGPFRIDEKFIGERALSSPPVEWNGRWYTVITGRWNEQRGLGLAVADSFHGPYIPSPHNPIFHVETTSRINPRLFRHNNTWAILYSHTYDNDTDRISTRIAITHLHPDLLRE